MDKACVTNQLVLTIGYDSENLKKGYRGDVTIDRYGRPIPKHAHGTINLDAFSSSARKIIDAALTLYDRIMDSELTVRRLSLTANHVISETCLLYTSNDLPQRLWLDTGKPRQII